MVNKHDQCMYHGGVSTRNRELSLPFVNKAMMRLHQKYRTQLLAIKDLQIQTKAQAKNNCQEDEEMKSTPSEQRLRSSSFCIEK